MVYMTEALLLQRIFPLSEDEMSVEIKCLPRGGFVAVIK